MERASPLRPCHLKKACTCVLGIKITKASAIGSYSDGTTVFEEILAK